ncbi:MAG: rhamnosyltransferase [Pseudohongiellaceae bacterium]|jgi:rhamnosyltransferase
MPSELHEDMIGAVVVTYYASMDELTVLLSSIKNQVDFIVVVDNSDEFQRELIDLCESMSVKVINNKENVGIAGAHNIGVEELRVQGAAHVLLFDQDSIPFDGMVDVLNHAYLSVRRDFSGPLLVGPTYKDVRTAKSALLVRVENGRVLKIDPESVCGNDKVETDFLISSGSFFDMESYDLVGEFQENLFIDCVDIEWGFRLRSVGGKVFCIPGAVMSHMLGDGELTFCGVSLTNHEPIRHYYYYRNFYFLLRSDYIPLGWKLYVFLKSSVQAIIFSTLTRAPALHFKMILKGIFHGLKGKLGKYE